MSDRDAFFDPFDDPTPRNPLDDVADNTAEVADLTRAIKTGVGDLEVLRRAQYQQLTDSYLSPIKSDLTAIVRFIKIVAWLLFFILLVLVAR